MSSSRFARILAVALVAALGVFVAEGKAALETVTSIRDLGPVSSQLSGSPVITPEVSNSAPGAYTESISATSGEVTIHASIESFVPDTRGDSFYFNYLVTAYGTIPPGQTWKGSASGQVDIELKVVDYPMTVLSSITRIGIPEETDLIESKNEVLEPGDLIHREADIYIHYEIKNDDPNEEYTFFELAQFTLVMTPLFYIDIKPLTCPNKLNLNSRGKLQVSILGTESFEASSLALSDFTLSRPGIPAAVSPLPSSLRDGDVATPFEGDDCGCHILGMDGYLDLTMRFDIEELVEKLEFDKMGDGETIPLILTFRNWDGTECKGADCVQIQKKWKPEKKKKK